MTLLGEAELLDQQLVLLRVLDIQLEFAFQRRGARAPRGVLAAAALVL